MRFQDLTGKRFGRLTVLRRVENKGRNTMWLCLCDCGNEHIVASNKLKIGNTQSCGCYRQEVCGKCNITHGKSHTKVYNTWQRMKDRCYNPNAAFYDLYGGRGISVCERWINSFENFNADMGDPPSPESSIDRIDPNGNYEPSNCRWATSVEQNSNKRNNLFLSQNGITKTITEWSRDTGIPRKTISNRLIAGKTIEQALQR